MHELWVAVDQTTFDAWWPEAQRRMLATLRRRGHRIDDVQDYLQLTAERAIRSEMTFESQDHFVNWCLRTSRHVSIDEWRRTRREYLEDVPDRHSADVADQVMARLDLALVEAEIPRLPRAQREAILAFDRVAGDRNATFRLSSARRAARLRLENVIGGSVAAFGGNTLRLLRRVRALVPAPLAAATVGVAIALSLSAQPHTRAMPLQLPVVPPSHTVAAPIDQTLSDLRRIADAANGFVPGAQVNVPTPPAPSSMIPAFMIPLGHNADGSPSGISGEPSDGSRPLACVSRTLVTKGFCTDPPIPELDMLLLHRQVI